jgi:hypothetical protein
MLQGTLQDSLFSGIGRVFPCDDTYRRSADKLNRVLWRKVQTDQVRSRTIANLVEREGESVQACIKEKAEHILACNGFSTDGKRVKKTFETGKEEAVLSQETICTMIEELNAGNPKGRHIDVCHLQETFEDTTQVKANISLDEVCCKKQKAEGRRKGLPPKEKREMVNNTVAHIQNGSAKTYTLNTHTITQMMIIVLAFLLQNGLLSQPGPLVFFTDGARNLRLAIQNVFCFLPFKIILDWHHLEKKCKDLLSMAINGKQIKSQILSELLACLVMAWQG